MLWIVSTERVLREQPVPVVDGLEEQRRERRVPVVAVDDRGAQLMRWQHSNAARVKHEEAQVLVRRRSCRGSGGVERRAVDQVDRRRRARQLRLPAASSDSDAGPAPAARPAGTATGAKAQLRAIDRRIERGEQPHVCARRVQVFGERRGHIGESAGLGKRRDLGGEQADAEGSLELRFIIWRLRAKV